MAFTLDSVADASYGALAVNSEETSTIEKDIVTMLENAISRR